MSETTGFKNLKNKVVEMVIFKISSNIMKQMIWDINLQGVRFQPSRRKNAAKKLGTLSSKLFVIHTKIEQVTWLLRLCLFDIAGAAFLEHSCKLDLTLLNSGYESWNFIWLYR